jgi:hypothetical protein
VALPAGRPSAAAARKALRDGLSGLLGAGIEVGPELAAATRRLTHRELLLVAYEVRLKRRVSGPSLRWVTPLEEEGIGVSSAVRVLLAMLQPAPNRPRP